MTKNSSNGKSETTEPAQYEVGYGRPPKATRFKPGSSGNPKGRPKGSKAPKTLLEEALSSPIIITEGGVTRKIEQREALFKSLVAKAIKGDARSASLLVRLMEQYGISDPNGSDPRKPIYIITGVPRSGDR